MEAKPVGALHDGRIAVREQALCLQHDPCVNELLRAIPRGGKRHPAESPGRVTELARVVRYLPAAGKVASDGMTEDTERVIM